MSIDFFNSKFIVVAEQPETDCGREFMYIFYRNETIKGKTIEVASINSGYYNI